MGAAAQVSQAALVGYASVNGFEASAGGTVQVTGAGKVLGLPPSYAADFPGNIRAAGRSSPGVLVAQQTAANLHVVPGDSVMIHRPGLPDATVTIDGVVDLPNANSMFQGIGLPPNAAPQAPPDNVLILPMAQWHACSISRRKVRPDSVRMQIHARLDHAHLPHDPQAAYLLTTSQGHNFEARVAGSALLSNNLAAVLGKAREDASYARILFFFLGTPGIAIAVLLTFAVAHAGAWRRRRDQSLLRLRGASTALLTRIAASEALAVGIVGSLIGVAIGELTSLALFSTVPFSAEQIVWIAHRRGHRRASLAGRRAAAGVVGRTQRDDHRRARLPRARSVRRCGRGPISTWCFSLLPGSSSGERRRRAIRSFWRRKAWPRSRWTTGRSLPRFSSGSAWGCSCCASRASA